MLAVAQQKILKQVCCSEERVSGKARSADSNKTSRRGEDVGTMDVWRGIKSMYHTNFGADRRQRPIKRIKLGICAMDKKAKSKPMREILSRLPEELFEVIIFGDECILNSPPEAWPVVEVLIAFYSSRYPTDKALQYVKLRKPFMINDLEMEATLKDRRKVYELLQANGIDVPVHVYCNRDGNTSVANVVEEFDEYIVVNGVQINKPLVEKPVDAEDHNIYIYYPMSAGGGSKRLFRKVDDRSSEFYPRVHELRKEGSYIYEEFVVTQGTDVKVYTVGVDYGHAEARKSPVVDGRVNRDQAGLEVRYPVILSHHEKDMARKIVLAFKQTVCGFDILRVHGRSFCCDVNGFSFVKNSRKYYDDASQVLCEMMVARCRPEFLAHPSTKRPPAGRAGHPSVVNSLTKQTLSLLAPKPVRSSTPTASSAASTSAALVAAAAGGSSSPQPSQNNLGGSVHGAGGASTTDGGGGGVGGGGGGGDRPASPQPSLMSVSRRGSHDNLNDRSSADEDAEELRCVIAVIRHGDRTPKQKMKVKVSHPKFLDYFHTFAKTPRKDLKVKSRSALVRFLEVTREIIDDGTVTMENDADLFRKLRQIRDVLERWEISGINRKLQMKPQRWADNWGENGAEAESGTPVGGAFGNQSPQGSNAGDLSPALLPPTPPRLSDAAPGLALQLPVAPPAAPQDQPPPFGLATEVLLILKWGGDLTPLGREQAEQVGARFRHEMYPDNAGGGVLRLHATYRHDLKIKASDEGRVMKTAAAFTKGLLELEGQLTPILASLVTVEEKNRQMLDRGGNVQIKEDMDRCKEHLNLLQQTDRVMDEELVDAIVAKDCPKAVRRALLSLGNPLQALRRLHALIGRLCARLQRIVELQELTMGAAAGSVGGGSSSSNSSSSSSSNSSSGGGGGAAVTGGVRVGGGSSARDCGSNGSGNNSGDGAATNTSGVDASASSNGDNSSTSSTQDSVAPTPSPANEPFPHSQVGEPVELPHDDPSGPSTPQGRGARVGSTHNSRSHVEENKLYLNETFSLMLDRWEKLNKDLWSSKTGQYDLTKVPDVYDMIRFDVLHNSHLEEQLGDQVMRELYETAAALENSVVPQEYGMDGGDKRVIGSKVCGALLEKIRYDLTMAREKHHDVGYLLDHAHAEDLEINSLSRAVRTRLYFTSESHLHTLLNAFRYTSPGELCAIDPEGLAKLDDVSELSYLTQIVIRLFENRENPSLCRCEISFSPGATNNPFTDKSASLAPYVTLSRSLNQDEMIQCITDAIFASEGGGSASGGGGASTVGSARGIVSNSSSLAGSPRPQDDGSFGSAEASSSAVIAATAAAAAAATGATASSVATAAAAAAAAATTGDDFDGDSFGDGDCGGIEGELRITHFDDSPVKPGSRVPPSSSKASSAAAATAAATQNLLLKPVPLRRTHSVTVVSDLPMADPWKQGWGAGGQG